MSLADRALTPDEDRLLAAVRAKLHISPSQEEEILREMGWSMEEYAACRKEDDPWSKECVVCLDAPATHIILDCYHLCLCEDCARRMSDEGREEHCPKSDLLLLSNHIHGNFHVLPTASTNSFLHPNPPCCLVLCLSVRLFDYFPQVPSAHSSRTQNLLITCISSFLCLDLLLLLIIPSSSLFLNLFPHSHATHCCRLSIVYNPIIFFCSFINVQQSSSFSSITSAGFSFLHTLISCLLYSSATWVYAIKTIVKLDPAGSYELPIQSIPLCSPPSIPAQFLFPIKFALFRTFISPERRHYQRLQLFLHRMKLVIECLVPCDCRFGASLISSHLIFISGFPNLSFELFRRLSRVEEE